MWLKRGCPTQLILVLLLLASHAHALSWRLFAGREECLGEYIPPNQWSHITEQTGAQHDSIPITVDIGIVVSSKYGTEQSRAAVDLTFKDPSGAVFYSEDGLNDDELSVGHKGSRGPWLACFRVARGRLLRPSVIVKVTHFTINSAAPIGTDFDWQSASTSGKSANTTGLGKAEQVEELKSGLQRLDHYLVNITNEQRYLYARTIRHLRTAYSTLGRTFWYYLAIYGVICLASFVQVAGVRFMFKQSRKQGLLF